MDVSRRVPTTPPRASLSSVSPSSIIRRAGLNEFRRRCPASSDARYALSAPARNPDAQFQRGDRLANPRLRPPNRRAGKAAFLGDDLE